MAVLVTACNSDKNPRYFNTRLSTEKRVDDLVSRMTVEEKISQLGYTAEAIERLNIPEYNWWNECLHGVARAGRATVFPQSIGLAATWDREQVYKMADVTSTEARAKYNDYQSKGKRGIYQGLTFWSPNINIFRDPRWGRGMETYGEDPYLTGEIGTEFIKGLQGDDPNYLKLVATSKHYAVHSGPEPARHSFDAVVSDRDFRDTYFPAFRKTILDGHAYSVMCAYNAYLGEPCCGSDPLLEDLLRNELGFEGYVVSDCGAIADFYNGHKVVETAAEASAMAVMAGTDLNCGSAYDALLEAVNNGLISEPDLDISVKRLMTARMKLGMFDPAEMVPWSDLSVDLVSCSKHTRIALETARKSMVLLKNENGALPLSEELGKIAVIGPNANDIGVLCGNYNGTPVDPITPLQGIKNRTEGSSRVKYARGCDHAEGMPYMETVPGNVLFTDKSGTEKGLKASFYANKAGEGEPVLTRTDRNIQVNFWDQAPAEGLEDDNYSVRWTGVIIPEVSGTYHLGCEAKYFRMKLNGEEILSRKSVHETKKVYKAFDLKAGQPYEIDVLLYDEQGDALISMIWAPPVKDLAREAIELASWADQVILFMGLSPQLEGEEMKVNVEGFAGGDRTSMELPRIQQDLIKKIMATGKPVVLVLLNGSALSINWESENIPAILEAWYPGESAGTAIADVLFGDYNPAGRLPVTFYKSMDDLPPFEDYNMAGRTYRYFEGEVLYPFGHGLSYAVFTYGEPVLDKSVMGADDEVTLSVDVTNDSEIKGEEVVQLYIHELDAPDARPLLDLRGFDRIMLKAGETKTVSFTLSKKELAYYNLEEEAYVLKPANYEIFVGGSSAKEKLQKVELEVK